MPQTKFKLANILLDDSEQFLYAPALLVRSKAPWHRSAPASDTWTFMPGEHDFTTFFNALSVAKWKEYTVAREFHLSFEVRGAAFTVVQTRADGFSWETEPVEGTARRIEASERWVRVDVPMLAAEGDVIEGFILRVEASGEGGGEGSEGAGESVGAIATAPAALELRRGSYYAVVDEASIRPVELALCTTTFRKEDYITRNIALVKQDILGSDEPIAAHFTQHVVDNGRMLDVEEQEAGAGGRVHVHPNDNVGGSGGYARGMIEALRQEPRATHVLLMDDDVLIAPESIIRTYNLLSLVNDAHAEAFVSGAMMKMDEPDVRWEDMGFVGWDGCFYPMKDKGSMNRLHDVVANESYKIPWDDPANQDRARQHYAAWWYCAIPVSQIERNGLPLPLFVRGDDVEYSLRCKPKFMTMNAICLWHLSFSRRYNAAQERYQMVRNVFINRFTTGMAPLSDIEGNLFHNHVQLELKKFNYTNADLALDGFEDFLRGPAFIMERGATERAFMDANRRAEKLLPLAELREQAAREGVDLSGIAALNFDVEAKRTELRSTRERLEDYLTFNGHRLDLGYVQEGTAAVIDVSGWIYPSDQIRRKDTIVAVDLENQRGVIRHLDRERFKEVQDRYHRLLREYEANKERLQQEYAEARARMTSLDFWMDYLGID